MNRYSVILNKNRREIVLLRGNGCKWLKCTFCDYHLDSSPDEEANFKLNKSVLANVTGEFGRLEIINSGSFTDLDEKTIREILRVALDKNIKTLHFECHWMHRDALDDFKRRFSLHGIEVKFKIGIETFDIEFRERVLKKGLDSASPAQIAAAGFSEANLLFGIDGQDAKSMRADIETALTYFERVCINIMTANSTGISPSEKVIREFTNNIYPIYADDPRVDILLENTDFGVG